MGLFLIGWVGPKLDGPKYVELGLIGWTKVDGPKYVRL